MHYQHCCFRRKKNPRKSRHLKKGGGAFQIKHYFPTLIHIPFSSVAQLRPTHCDPMNHSTPGIPVHHQLPESTQTHVY